MGFVGYGSSFYDAVEPTFLDDHLPVQNIKLQVLYSNI